MRQGWGEALVPPAAAPGVLVPWSGLSPVLFIALDLVSGSSCAFCPCLIVVGFNSFPAAWHCYVDYLKIISKCPGALVLATKHPKIWTIGWQCLITLSNTKGTPYLLQTPALTHGTGASHPVQSVKMGLRLG